MPWAHRNPLAPPPQAHPTLKHPWVLANLVTTPPSPQSPLAEIQGRGTRVRTHHRHPVRTQVPCPAKQERQVPRPSIRKGKVLVPNRPPHCRQQIITSTSRLPSQPPPPSSSTPSFLNLLDLQPPPRTSPAHFRFANLFQRDSNVFVNLSKSICIPSPRSRHSRRPLQQARPSPQRHSASSKRHRGTECTTTTT